MSFTKEQLEAAESQIVEQSKKIEYYLTDYSVELLAQKMRSNEFVIPDYQREDTWEPERKARFIESLLMNLPVPFLFFWEISDGNLEVVDGSQRLRTIDQFIQGHLVLDDLETLDSLNGMSYLDLPESRQKKIRNRSIRGIVLNEHADDQARFEIFERINTGSKIANKAEVRRGAIVGPFLDMVIDLSTNDTFVDLAPLSSKDVNLREREELVTRFFAYSDAFLLDPPLQGYRDRPAEFLFKYAKTKTAQMRSDSKLEGILRKRFNDTLAFINDKFPYGFRRSPQGKDSPRSRFEAIAVGSFLALKERPTLVKKTISFDWLEKEEFLQAIGADGANVRSRLVRRVTYVRDQLLGR